MRSVRTAALGLGLLAVSGAARADVIFGGNARSFGMGGAGIAIVDRSERNTLLNPAALALFNRRSKLEYPHIGFHASGVSWNTAFDHIFSGPNANDAVSIAKDFGKQESSYGLGLGWGIRIAHMDAHLDGEAAVHVFPNEALQTWAKTADGDVTKLTGQEKADLYGAAIYSLPEVGAATRISPAGSKVRVEAGTRIRLERAVYTHYLVNSENIANNTPATPAPELNGGTTRTRDGIGVDFGFLMHPAEHKGFSAAFVAFNAVEPGFTFTGTDVNGNPAKFALQPRSISAGTAWEGGRVIGAFDVVDVTRAYGNVQARLGGEYTTHGLAFRAGYNSASGFTAGFGRGWIQLAFGNRAPLQVTSTLQF
jgi:hypothetical protein